MNALALHLPCKLTNAAKPVRLNLSLGPQSIQSVICLLEDHGYLVSSDITHLHKEDCYSLLINAEIDPHWITPFSRWLLRKANLASLQTELEGSDGKIIAQCILYRAGISNF